MSKVASQGSFWQGQPFCQGIGAKTWMLLEICKYHVKLIYSAIYSARVYVAMLRVSFPAFFRRLFKTYQ